MTSTVRLQINLGLALFMLAATTICADEVSSLPKRFSAHIGGFLGASYGLELKDGTLTYTNSARAGSRPKEKTITPTAAQWREFHQALDDLNVWQWRSEYSTHGFVEG